VIARGGVPFCIRIAKTWLQLTLIAIEVSQIAIEVNWITIEVNQIAI
jgi:hypothetical protein